MVIMMKMMTMTMLTVTGTIPEFSFSQSPHRAKNYLQTPHRAMNYLQHACIQDQDIVKYKSYSTHQARITCCLLCAILYEQTAQLLLFTELKPCSLSRLISWTETINPLRWRKKLKNLENTIYKSRKIHTLSGTRTCTPTLTSGACCESRYAKHLPITTHCPGRIWSKGWQEKGAHWQSLIRAVINNSRTCTARNAKPLSPWTHQQQEHHCVHRVTGISAAKRERERKKKYRSGSSNFYIKFWYSILESSKQRLNEQCKFIVKSSLPPPPSPI